MFRRHHSFFSDGSRKGYYLFAFAIKSPQCAFFYKLSEHIDKYVYGLPDLSHEDRMEREDDTFEHDFLINWQRLCLWYDVPFTSHQFRSVIPFAVRLPIDRVVSRAPPIYWADFLANLPSNTSGTADSKEKEMSAVDKEAEYDLELRASLRERAERKQPSAK